MTILKSSHKWRKIWRKENPRSRLLDLDGWDKKDLKASMNQEITREEFDRRASICTVSIRERKKRPAKSQ